MSCDQRNTSLEFIDQLAYPDKATCFLYDGFFGDFDSREVMVFHVFYDCRTYHCFGEDNRPLSISLARHLFANRSINLFSACAEHFRVEVYE